MSASIQVKCSGALYTSLHCELINRDKIQEGFLLGEIEKFTSHSISDSEIDNENSNININISGYIPCSTVGGFYSGCGRINFQYIKHIAGPNIKKIVGWYRSRSVTDNLFLKETRVHEQLRKELADTSDYFLFALFSRVKPATEGKMDVNYKFHIMLNNNEFEGVSLTIVNMKDTSTSQYIKTASSVLYDSGSLQNIIGNIQNKEPGVKEAETLHTGLLNQISTLLPKYASVHEQYQEALKHVNTLRERCHNLGLKIDFQVDESIESDFDLLEVPCSPTKLQSDSATNLNLVKKTENGDKGDPFHFVEKEINKEQGNAKKNLCKTKKETVKQGEKCDTNESNDIKNTRSLKTTKKSVLGSESSSLVKTSLDLKARTEKDIISSPVRKTVKDTKEKVVSRDSKVLQSSQLDSVDSDKKEQDRDLSTAKETNTPCKKPKENETMTDNKLCSDSPEF